MFSNDKKLRMDYLLSSLLVLCFLGYSLVYGHGTKCVKDGLIECDSREQCYDPKLRCNGFWDCVDHSDEKNCTADMRVNGVGKVQNLAWLVTPILLLVGTAYGIYKCAKDGVCAAIKRRILHGRRERENRASDYHPLHQVSFFTSSRIPCPQFGLDTANLTPEQMMLIHNQSFSIQIHRNGAENPMLSQSLVPSPPSYDETMAAISDGHGGTIVVLKNGQMIAIPQGCVNPPPYSGSGSHLNSKKPHRSGAPNKMMDAIEEEEEVQEEEDNCDEAETFSLLKETVDGKSIGRHRHHSQWSQKQRFSDRRRHHSCPS